MFKNWSIAKKLIFGFGLVIFITILMSGISMYFLFNLKNDVLYIHERAKNLHKLREIKEKIFKDFQDNLLGFLIVKNTTQKKKYYNKFLEAGQEYNKILKYLRKHIKSSEGKEYLNNIVNSIIDLEKYNNKAIKLSVSGKREESIALYEKEIIPRINKIYESMNELENFYQENLHNKVMESLKYFQNSITVMLIFTSLAFFLSIFLALIISSSINKPVQKLKSVLERIKEGDLNAEIDIDSKDEIGLIAIAIKETIERLKHVISDVRNVSRDIVNFSGKLSGITNEFSNNLNMQAEKATQIASSAEEMSITIVDIAKNTNNILENSKNTAEVSKKGEEMTLKTAEEIKTIEQAAEKLQSIMGDLEERSKTIENVLTFIKDVAEQTNLLALNATIEAARAGEHGKSFAVVAGEIRKLAERTNKSTDEIGQMIKEIQVVVSNVKGAVDDINKKVASGVKLSEETSEILKEITKQSESLQEMIQSIASATEEMSTVADQVSQDINSVAQASREMTQGVEEIIKTVENMSNLSIKLNKSIEFFKMDKDVSGEKCPNLERCPFFGDRLENMPATAELLKSEYCLGEGKNYKECARYIVASTLGKEFVPPDLFPHQKERALEIIKANKK